MKTLIACTVFACVFVAAQSAACPPPGFDSVENLDLERFISAPWFVTQQQPLAYQPEDQLYCVRAEYTPIDPNNLLKGLVVKNYANRGQVNGPAVGTSNSTNNSGGFRAKFSFRNARLTAKIPDPQDLSKLTVGFDGLLGRIAGRGPYWVVAIDPDYQWTIITGGAPEVETSNAGKCATSKPGNRFSRFQVNGVGFWLFARNPLDAQATQVMLQRAHELGLDTSLLKVVAQEGCTYQGA